MKAACAASHKNDGKLACHAETNSLVAHSLTARPPILSNADYWRLLQTTRLVMPSITVVSPTQPLMNSPVLGRAIQLLMSLLSRFDY